MINYNNEILVLKFGTFQLKKNKKINKNPYLYLSYFLLVMIPEHNNILVLAQSTIQKGKMKSTIQKSKMKWQRSMVRYYVVLLFTFEIN